MFQRDWLRVVPPPCSSALIDDAARHQSTELLQGTAGQVPVKFLLIESIATRIVGNKDSTSLTHWPFPHGGKSA